MFDTDRNETGDKGDLLFAQAQRYPLLDAEEERAADAQKWQAIRQLLAAALDDPVGACLLRQWSDNLLHRPPLIDRFGQREHYNLLKREHAELLSDAAAREHLHALAQPSSASLNQAASVLARDGLQPPCVLMTGLAELLLQRQQPGSMAVALGQWMAHWPASQRLPDHAVHDDTRSALEGALARYYSARSRLIRHNIRLVYAIAGRLNARGLPYEDLVQAGMIGLIRAAEKYRSSTGYRFSTYAYNWINQSIRQHIEDMQGILRYPAGVNEQLSRLYRRRLDLAQQQGREPSVEELARSLDTTPEAVNQLRQVNNQSVSLHSPVAIDGEGLTLAETLPDEQTRDTADGAQAMSLQRCLSSTLQSLNRTEREVVILRWGLGPSPPLTREQIADRLQVSREWVRQLEASALDKLRKDQHLAQVYRDATAPAT